METELDYNDPKTWLKGVIDEDIKIIVKAAKTVYNELGTGHTEAVYESALEVELFERGWTNIRRQVSCPIIYKNFVVGTGYIDLLINNTYIVELKAVVKITDKEKAQLKKYIRDNQCGILLNFNPSTEKLEVVNLCD